MKLRKIQVALQKSERKIGLAEAALRASYAEEVSAMTTFRSWWVSAMHGALRLLREQHDLQEDVLRKPYKEVAFFDSEERMRGERE